MKLMKEADLRARVASYPHRKEWRLVRNGARGVGANWFNESSPPREDDEVLAIVDVTRDEAAGVITLSPRTIPQSEQKRAQVAKTERKRRQQRRAPNENDEEKWDGFVDWGHI